MYVLTIPLQAHYARKELRNGYGLNGPTCSERNLKKETELASQIPEDNIKILSKGIFEIVSRSEPGCIYSVIAQSNSCTCDTFKLNEFCHHLFKCRKVDDENIDSDSPDELEEFYDLTCQDGTS